MTHERLDPALLAVMAAAGAPLTAERLGERCDDPWAPALVTEWLDEAFHRGLVNVRRQADLPAEWLLTPKGRKAARKL